MKAEEIKALERRNFETMNKGKEAVMKWVDEDCAPDYVLHSSVGRDIRGHENNKRFCSDLYDALPDMHFTVDDMVVEGDKAVVRYTMTGTHKGAYMGIPPTNRKITIWAIEIDRVAGGKFIESWVRVDTLGFMQQLGIIPVPKK
jgi:predicted ester cyclase